MSIEITSYQELLEFIKKDNVSVPIANFVANKYLNTYDYIDDKDKLIEAVSNYIDRWANYKHERPLFLI